MHLRSGAAVGHPGRHLRPHRVVADRIGRSGGALGGRGLAIGGLVTGYLGVATLLVLPVLAALLLPAVASAREKARQASCLSNLKQIGLGVIMYAADNDEVLPPDLAAPQPYIHNPQVYRCPSAEAGAAEVGFHSDYEYLGAGLGQSRIERPAETVLVVDNAARHSGGVNITFADGHARYLAVPSGQHWRAAAQAQGWVIPGGGVP